MEGKTRQSLVRHVTMWSFYRADTGFKHVKPDEYIPRLLHFHGDKKGVTLKEVPLCKLSIDSSDVFILDLGLEVYQVYIRSISSL